MLSSFFEELDSFGLSGVDFNITKNNVKATSFVPTYISRESSDFDMLSNPYRGFKAFRVYLVEPFFLPLKSTVNGSFERLIYNMPEILIENEEISISWIFMEVEGWRNKAVNMYKSYLEGNNNPSSIPTILKMQDKFYMYVNKFSSDIQSRNYKKEVENKILSKGYAMQCIVYINSERVATLASLIQEILMAYDYHNYLRLEEIEPIYPYNLVSAKQIISKDELMSFFIQSEEALDENATQENDLIEQADINTSMLDYRISLLPAIPKSEVRVDEGIIGSLADALKLVGIIKQARLYNESVKQGARLTVITTDMPKGKNFSDIEKRRRDIQVAMGVNSLSIEQGDRPNTVKFSFPHHDHQVISLKSLLEDGQFQEYRQRKELSFIGGVDEVGNPIYLSVQELRHLLISGSTGSGKSVFVNCLITTLLMTNSPEDLTLVLIDPKQVELQQYEGFPHVSSLVTEMNKCNYTLDQLVIEMENRYTLFSEHNVKDINSYNAKNKHKKIPYIVCVIEEYADLVDSIGKGIEIPIKRLGQKSRAAGIHLVIVTQRPSAEVINSDIQSNLTNAISFNLGNNTNYKTVFGKGIPYQLIGEGDGVIKSDTLPKEFQRFQSPIIALDDDELDLFYTNLASSYSGSLPQVSEEDDLLYKLKQLIATTQETRVTVLRDKMGIRSSSISSLMDRLVEEGWLKKHKSRAKGYELIADKSVLNEWID